MRVAQCGLHSPAKRLLASCHPLSNKPISALYIQAPTITNKSLWIKEHRSCLINKSAYDNTGEMGVRLAPGTFDFDICNIVSAVRPIFLRNSTALPTLSMIAGFNHKRQDGFGPRLVLVWFVPKDPPWLIQVPVDQGRSLRSDRSSLLDFPERWAFESLRGHCVRS